MTHTPRFTAKAPPLPPPGRLSRCITVKACDIELRDLVTRLHRTWDLETMAGIHADIDEVLDRRTELAVDEAAALAIQVANEPRPSRK